MDWQKRLKSGLYSAIGGAVTALVAWSATQDWGPWAPVAGIAASFLAAWVGDLLKAKE